MTHLLVRPRGARYLFVLAHGAGAGMRHAFMAELADALAAERVATWRWEFPYMEAGRTLPDKPAVAEAAVRDAWTAARVAVKLPAFAGGKSFGGRMTSQAHAGAPLRGLCGIAFVGFPLQPPARASQRTRASGIDKPGLTRAAHLVDASGPLLFVQGTRDGLAPLPRLRPVIAALGPRAELHVIDRADHALAGRAADIATAIAAWMRRIAP